MQHQKNTKRIGISFKVSLVTVIVLAVILAGMVTLIGKQLDEDLYAVQIQGYRAQVNAITELVTFQTRLVERLLGSHGLNQEYGDGLVAQDFSASESLLASLDSQLRILDAVLLVDTEGTVVSAADDERIGASIRETGIWRKIAEGGASPVDYVPSVSPFSDRPVIYYAVRVFRDRREVGFLVAAMDLKAFNSIYMDRLAFGETGYPFIFTEGGRIVSHHNGELIGDDVSGEGFYQEVDDNIRNNRYSDQTVEYSFDGEQRVMVYMPVSGSSDWIAAVSMTKDEMKAPTQAVLRMIGLIGLASAVIMVIGLVLFIRTFLIRRIHEMSASLQTAATGDLSNRVSEKGNDEFTDINHRFNRLTESLAGLITQVRDKMDRLQNGGMELSSNIQETSAAINQINANIESTRGQVDSQSVSISETSATVEEITKNIESLNTSIEQQSQNVTESSSAVEEMVESIRGISSTTDKAAEEVATLKQTSEEGKTRMDKMIGLIREVSGMSTALGEANSVIADIASQTNLLSMNAAIEAAHAGEAGAGFSIVADEIRKLAENASSQSGEVEGRLKEVTKAVNQIVEISSQTDAAFARITSSVDNVQQVFEEMRTALKEQSSGSENLLSRLNEMNEITETVRSGSEEMKQGNSQILEVITNLNSISEEVKNAIEEIARGTGEINQAVQNIVDLSNDNTESIRLVKTETKKFALTSEEAQSQREEKPHGGG